MTHIYTDTSFIFIYSDCFKLSNNMYEIIYYSITDSSNFFSTSILFENTSKYTCTSLVILFLVLLRYRTSSQRNNSQRSFVQTRTAFYEGQRAKSMNLQQNNAAPIFSLSYVRDCVSMI